MRPSSPNGPCSKFECDIWLHPGQHLGDVAADVDAGDAITTALGGIGTIVAGPERNLALCGPAAKENRHMLA